MTENEPERNPRNYRELFACLLGTALAAYLIFKGDITTGAVIATQLIGYGIYVEKKG